MKLRLFSLAALLLGTSPALADDLLTIGNGIVRDYLCVGSSCMNPESYSSSLDTLRLKAFNTSIHFDDASTSLGAPANDWRIVANDSTWYGANYLAFQDATSGSTPFKVLAGAPDNALYVAANGRIGVGTMLPQRDVEIVGFTPAIRLQQQGTANYWTMSALSTFTINDNSADSVPLIFEPGAPTDSLRLKSDGDIGLGTADPEGKLHTRGTGTQLAYFESSDEGAVQVRFRTDSQNRRFLAVNNANEVKSQIVFGDDQIQFLGETVAQEWLRVSSAGIVSSGPTCNPNPCDRTFDPEHFEVPAIEDRAAYMWENMHLPAVGPTAPDAPFNMTEKMGGVIHELEVAHIYIQQLHNRLEAEAVQKAIVQEQIADLAALNDEQNTMISELLDRLQALEAE